MAGLTVGYARVSTDAQDLTAQRDALPSPDSECRPIGCTPTTG